MFNNQKGKVVINPKVNACMLTYNVKIKVCVFCFTEATSQIEINLAGKIKIPDVQKVEKKKNKNNKSNDRVQQQRLLQVSLHETISLELYMCLK